MIFLILGQDSAIMFLSTQDFLDLNVIHTKVYKLLLQPQTWRNYLTCNFHEINGMVTPLSIFLWHHIYSDIKLSSVYCHNTSLLILIVLYCQLIASISLQSFPFQQCIKFNQQIYNIRRVVNTTHILCLCFNLIAINAMINSRINHDWNVNYILK